MNRKEIAFIIFFPLFVLSLWSYGIADWKTTSSTGTGDVTQAELDAEAAARLAGDASYWRNTGVALAGYTTNPDPMTYRAIRRIGEVGTTDSSGKSIVRVGFKAGLLTSGTVHSAFFGHYTTGAGYLEDATQLTYNNLTSSPIPADTVIFCDPFETTLTLDKLVAVTCYGEGLAVAFSPDTDTFSETGNHASVLRNLTTTHGFSTHGYPVTGPMIIQVLDMNFKSAGSILIEGDSTQFMVTGGGHETLARQLADKYDVTFGGCAANTEAWESRHFEERFCGSHYDQVLITGGSNDFANGASAETVEGYVLKMADIAVSHGAVVGTAGVLPRTGFKGTSKETARVSYNNWGYTLPAPIKFAKNFDGALRNASDPHLPNATLFWTDLIHPDQDGHNEMFVEWYRPNETLAKMQQLKIAADRQYFIGASGFNAVGYGLYSSTPAASVEYVQGLWPPGDNEGSATINDVSGGTYSSDAWTFIGKRFADGVTINGKWTTDWSGTPVFASATSLRTTESWTPNDLIGKILWDTNVGTGRPIKSNTANAAFVDTAFGSAPTGDMEIRTPATIIDSSGSQAIYNRDLANLIIYWVDTDTNPTANGILQDAANTTTTFYYCKLGGSAFASYNSNPLAKIYEYYCTVTGCQYVGWLKCIGSLIRTAANGFSAVISGSNLNLNKTSVVKTGSQGAYGAYAANGSDCKTSGGAANTKFYNFLVGVAAYNGARFDTMTTATFNGVATNAIIDSSTFASGN